MSKEDKYKQTDIGRIPIDWEVVKLADKGVTDLIMGQSPPSSTYNKKGEGLTFLQGKAEFGEIYPKPILFCSHPIKIAEKNDILLSVRAPVGDVNIASNKSCIGRGLAAIRSRRIGLYYLFLFYYLKYNKKTFEKISTGSTFKAVKKSDIENYLIPLPSLPEQQKIAEILSTVDDAIGKVDEAIEKTQKLKKGLMQELLTKGIGHKKFKLTEVGKIPIEWKIGRLDEIGELQYGFTASAKKINTGVKFLRITDIKEDQPINWSEVPYCSIKEDDFKKYELKEGNILFTRIGATTGKSCYINRKIKSVFASYLIRFQPTTNINTNFLYFYTRSPIYWVQVNKNKEGQLKKGLNARILGGLKVPLPNLSEQKKIAEILDTADKRLELLRGKKQKFERIKKGLMGDLLTGKKRVRI